jgi:lysophospholipase
MPQDARADLFGIPENPVPEGAVVEILTAEDGVRLRAARWMPTASPCKGTVCLFQGRAETIEKYFETIGDLRRRGFAVATLDWRGQGGSARLTRNAFKGHVSDFRHYQRDIEVFMTRFALPECPPPFFGLAHSMGSAIALTAARRRFTWFERLVLSAPMFGLPPRQSSKPVRTLVRSLVALGLGRALVPVSRGKLMPLGPFDGNILTTDPKRYARTCAILTGAPELRLGPPTLGWINAAFAIMDDICGRGFPASLRTPVLIFAASGDRVVCNRAITLVARRLRTARVIPIDGAQHELLMERDAVREGLLAAFDSFIPGTPAFPEDGADAPRRSETV